MKAPLTPPVLGPEAVCEYLALRARAQRLFPGLFVAVRNRVEAEVGHLGARGVVGEFDRENVMAMFPELSDAVPLDWVAFGFPGRPFYDAHVGVVLETAEWPVVRHVGLHLREPVWERLSSELERVDWPRLVGCEPEAVVAAAVREHRLSDVPRPFDFTDVEREVAELAARAAAYYRAAAPIIKGGTA